MVKTITTITITTTEYNVDNNNNDNNNNNNDNVYASRLMMSQVCAGQVLSLQAKEPFCMHRTSHCNHESMCCM